MKICKYISEEIKWTDRKFRCPTLWCDSIVSIWNWVDTTDNRDIDKIKKYPFHHIFSRILLRLLHKIWVRMRRCEGAWVPQWAQLRWRRRRGSRCRRRAPATTARWTAGRWCRPPPRPTVQPTLLTEEVRHWHLQPSNWNILSIIYAQATKSTVRMDQVWRRMGRVWWPTGPWWPRSRSRRATGRRRPTRRRCPLLAPPTSSSWRASSSPTR